MYWLYFGNKFNLNKNLRTIKCSFSTSTRFPLNRINLAWISPEKQRYKNTSLKYHSIEIYLKSNSIRKAITKQRIPTEHLMMIFLSEAFPNVPHIACVKTQATTSWIVYSALYASNRTKKSPYSHWKSNENWFISFPFNSATKRTIIHMYIISNEGSPIIFQCAQYTIWTFIYT